MRPTRTRGRRRRLRLRRVRTSTRSPCSRDDRYLGTAGCGAGTHEDLDLRRWLRVHGAGGRRTGTTVARRVGPGNGRDATVSVVDIDKGRDGGLTATIHRRRTRDADWDEGEETGGVHVRGKNNERRCTRWTYLRDGDEDEGAHERGGRGANGGKRRRRRPEVDGEGGGQSAARTSSRRFLAHR